MGTQLADLHKHPVTCTDGAVSDAFKSRHSPHADLRVSKGGPGRVHVTYTVRALLALVAALATFAVASPSTAQQGPARWDKPVLTAPAVQGCQSPAPSTAAGYADLWAALPSTQWGGGDVSISVPLADGRVVWLYGDTFSSGNFVHSSAITQDRGCLHVSGRGAQVLPNRDASTVYWIESARAYRGGLLVEAQETRIGSSGGWDFAYTGYTSTALVTVDASGDLTFKRWVKRELKAKPDAGPLLVFGPGHFGYSVREHPEARLASGEVLVTVAQNWDDGKLHVPSAYAPLWFEGRDEFKGMQ